MEKNFRKIGLKFITNFEETSNSANVILEKLWRFVFRNIVEKVRV